MSEVRRLRPIPNPCPSPQRPLPSAGADLKPGRVSGFPLRSTPVGCPTRAIELGPGSSRHPGGTVRNPGSLERR